MGESAFVGRHQGREERLKGILCRTVQRFEGRMSQSMEPHLPPAVAPIEINIRKRPVVPQMSLPARLCSPPPSTGRSSGAKRSRCCALSWSFVPMGLCTTCWEW